MLQFTRHSLVCCALLLAGCSPNPAKVASTQLAQILREDAGHAETEVRFEAESSDASLREFSAFCDAELTRRTEASAQVRALDGLTAEEKDRVVAFFAVENSVIGSKRAFVESLIPLSRDRELISAASDSGEKLSKLSEEYGKSNTGEGLEKALACAEQAQAQAFSALQGGIREVKEESAAKAALARYDRSYSAAMAAQSSLTAFFPRLPPASRPTAFRSQGASVGVERAASAAGLKKTLQ